MVFNILTDASKYAKWNSTIVSLEGQIKEGEKIKLVSSLDPERTFKIKVNEIRPNDEMVWGDAMGKRVFSLSETEKGIKFAMTEKIGNIIFPLFANKIPPFDKSFEAFAADLKKEAESMGK